ncbi:hypothetical protein MNB_SV-3-429 [hydrothermal vent metagenome]|uniref:Prokaryotic metallothionein n=1 Tax=hydrothermal vent metagenome TaxID=652676 RepID=A0A1W1CXY7_9ZZZZ
MILKLLIFAIIGVWIYKLLGGKLPTVGKTPQEKSIEEDTLVECEKCGTYVTVKESMIVQGKYYCSKECTE